MIVIDGEPWFVLTDLCKVLDLTNPRNVAARLADDQKGVRPVDTLGGQQSMTIVSEAGMYEVVFRSDKPEAVAFRRWITGTVLPEIRRTGSFNAQPALPQTREERFALALVDAKQMIVERDETIKELTAPARSWQLLADARGDFSVAEAAKILSRDPSITTGRDRLFDFMAEQKWIFRSKNARGGWEAYQTAVDTRRLVEKPAKPFLNSKTGAYELPAPTIRVTAKGIGKLHELMGGTEPIRFVVGEAS
ncbi:phage antirepressor KilAC domain-containing protein [Mycolicibacterium bacteremicum]|uniref:phage antirepressor KilAC domain-containing protein n=1 Tax=Mycolicibacterium bacteremicum TaxID=564198 RepID=UPI001F23010D|nr:phage antirepressor KilAC domain-containing protein [Mycolicibacterium bacteremicum]